jgi:glycosyltransferase involved in cell wall biosynthesis
MELGDYMKDSKKELPIISIVIATRNRLDELQKAIESCRMQNYGNIEILIFDDASEEDIYIKLLSTYCNYPCVKYY